MVKSWSLNDWSDFSSFHTYWKKIHVHTTKRSDETFQHTLPGHKNMYKALKKKRHDTRTLSRNIHKHTKTLHK